ncbi:ABC transporter substrate-binding protein [Rhizorhabdus histidinilytica]|uniref:Amino acid/amide ABC transporter substrate-binding protein, HAAT family n=1 Tax=Rhizorhabdus histidinilytica TaxID=439228 RepID=A0A1T5EW40_9SPHN|nr:ABC transporter substrate-binding protein [Rhizorhabdus histidinilytica]SKB87930.1 amino acid/amide ABC transporter substrate-binding protein, HAAT family [Rhizorhabdus histidinilytica]
MTTGSSRPSRVAALLAGLLSLAHAGPAAAREALPPIVIGQLSSRTGNNPAGREGENGAMQAVAEINAAGGLLGGRRLELHVEDDQTQVEPGIAALARLVGAGASAVVGSSFSNISLAIIPHVEQAGIPYLSTGAADGQVDPVRPHVFMTSLAGRLVGEQLLRFLRDRGVTRLAVVYDHDSRFASSGWAKQRTLLDRYGIALVEEQAVRVDTKDFGATIAALRGSSAQAVMAWLTGPPAVGFTRAYVAAQVGLPVVVSHGVASGAFLRETGAASEGLFVATSIATLADEAPASAVGDAARAMAAGFRRDHGQGPSQYAVDGYVAIRLIAAAIERGGSASPAAIRDALEGLTLATPQGVYRYTADDHAGLDVADIAVARVKDGRFTLSDWSRRQLGAGHGSEARR